MVFSRWSERSVDMEDGMRSLPPLGAPARRLQAHLFPHKTIFLDVETESKPGLLMKAY